MRPSALILLALALAGCAAKPISRVPSGEAIAAPLSAAAPADAGDPPRERNGTLPAAANAQENKPSAHALAATPRAALRAYALAYGNWTAAALPTRMRRLAQLAVGPARLTAEQTAASHSADTQLEADHVHNEATIITITPSEKPRRDTWVIITQERTTGNGPYTGLPSTLHITLARVRHLHDGWTVSQWQPTP